MDRVLGIICANYDTPKLGILTSERSSAALPFAGRFRLIDFALSNMAYSKIGTIGLITPYKYRSIIDHVGAGKEWGLDKKNGGLFVSPGSLFGISEKTKRFLLRDIRKNNILLKRSSSNYVVLSSANAAYNIDYNEMLSYHKETKADITFLVNTAKRDHINMRGIVMDNGYVTDISDNASAGDTVFLDSFILSTELLSNFCTWYKAVDFMDIIDIIKDNLGKFKVAAFKHNGYSAGIFTTSDYFLKSLDLLNPKYFDELFHGKHSIITKVGSTAPSKYFKDSNVSNSLIPSGCEIFGNVDNSILFRDVHVAKGAIIKNSILMQSCKIMENAVIENCIIDRGNIISANTKIAGTSEGPFVIGKNEKKV